jgi:hypothetical protein
MKLKDTTLAVIFIFLGLSSFFLGTKIDLLTSPDDYMVVNGPIVEDTLLGQDPVLKVSREIFQEFRGEWTVEVNSSDGKLVCDATSSNNYQVGNDLPETVKLFAWWMYTGEKRTAQCKPGMYPLPEGCYTVSTIWDIPSARVSIKRDSNVFCIRKE